MSQTRKFEAIEAKRQQVPLLIGLFGASSSGKTYSALRLATGMQQVTGGDIYVIDTEAKRALHYADRFKFKHVEFKAPFGSLDYLEAMKWCVAQGAKVIVTDSMSHEHEGVGGYLQTHDAELQRLGGRMSDNFTAWIKPANERRQMINGMLQLNANFVFCFRAKDKLKIEKGKSPTPLGYMPIGGEEFLFEQTMNCLLLPGSDGRPEWEPAEQGSKTMIKLPEQFRGLDTKAQLNEDLGRQLATWAAGGDIEDAPKKTAAPKMTAEEWANEQMRVVPALKTEEAFYAWLDLNGPAMAKLKAKDESTWAVLNDAVKAQRAKLVGDDE